MKVVNELKKKKVFENKIKSVDTKGDIHITTFVKTTPMGKLLGDEKKRIGKLSKWYGKSRVEKKILPEEEESFINFCVNLLEKYFSIVRDRLGSKWENSKTYLAATDRGVRAFLRIFDWILDYSNGLKNEGKIKKCLDVLEKNFPFEKSENKRMYLGEGGADELAEEWIGLIQEKYPKFGPRSETKAQHQVFNRKEAGKKIKEIFRHLTGDEVIGELTYVDPTTVDYLRFIPTYCSIKLFVHGGKDWDKFKEKRVKKLRHKVVQIKEIKKIDGKRYLHARWIADKNVKIDFENDLKYDALNSRQTIKLRTYPRIDIDYRAFKEKWNKTDKELKQIGIKAERVV